jgi:DNA topoisomerase-1
MVDRPPASLAKLLKRDELRLYALIWERFVASQMASALFDQTTVDVAATPLARTPAYTLRATGSVLKFAGFTAVYEEGRDDEAGAKERPLLPALAATDGLEKKKLEHKQHFTEPPPRYTEATLVKALEENGIGRPSTYSSIVETIQARGYAEQSERRFRPTEIGIAVNDLLAEHFRDIMDLKYTAKMESELDQVEEQREDWVKVLRDFYGPFATELEEAERKLPKLELRDEPTDDICEKCGRPMVIKTGRFGRFISCTGYPECKTTKPILKDTGALCPKDGGMVVERRSKRGRTFYGCANYPACDFVSWDRVIPGRCPVCDSYLIAKSRRGVVTNECARDREHELGALASGAADEPEAQREPAGV